MRNYILLCVVLVCSLLSACYKGDSTKNPSDTNSELYIKKKLSDMNKIKPGNYSEDKDLRNILIQEQSASIAMEDAYANFIPDIESLFKKYGVNYNSDIAYHLVFSDYQNLYLELQKEIPNLIKTDPEFIKISEKMPNFHVARKAYKESAKSLINKWMSILIDKYGWTAENVVSYLDEEDFLL